MTREEALKKAINIVAYFEAHFAKSKEAREDAANIIEALEQEPCEDAISRQATIEAFQMFRGYEANRTNAEWVDRIETVVKKLPPVNPREPKTGHWIKENPPMVEQYPFCSECGFVNPFENALNYCPNCGARMIEPTESEETDE